MSIARKILMGSSGGKKSTYVDDVFSTYLYRGTATESGNTGQTITNGIDLAGEGGMSWLKVRTNSTRHAVVDTVRGAGRMLATNETSASTAEDLTGLASFNSDGFTLGNESGGYQRCNMQNQDYASWSFRKAPGFFDVLTYTGNGSNRTIAHNLGSVPGSIWIKCTSEAGRDWTIYHRGLAPVDPASYRIRFTNGPRQGNAGYFNSTEPTSTHFSLGSNSDTNANGQSYVAYIFAGGESTADTARSISLNGSNEGFITNTSSDYNFGTGDFTVEFWINPDNPFTVQQTVDHRTPTVTSGHWVNYIDNNGAYKFWMDGDRITGRIIHENQWVHIATVRNSGTTTLYMDGVSQGTWADSTNYTNQELTFGVHGPNRTSYPFDGKYSNVRVVKGTAVYTESFRPPTAPLTNITNTKLLCANNSSVTGTTVGTVISVSSPTASTDSPFDDLEGFQFGEDGDQNIIKCGTYDGNPNSANIDVEIGWEPQFFMVKNLGIDNANNEWLMWDSTRGIFTNANDPRLSPTESAAEYGGMNGIDLSSNGIRVRNGDGRVNGGSGQRLIYIAIRRPDGYVGKPAEAGTDAFAMDYGSGSSNIPTFDSGFPVDFGFYRIPTQAQDFTEGARLTGTKYLLTNATNSEADNSYHLWDSNVGWSKGHSSSYLSWMWKRGAGFDVVAYDGQTELKKDESHGLNAVPEMMWVKARSGQYAHISNWFVYHKDLNGGTNPEYYNLELNTNAQEAASGLQYWQRPPTKTHFTRGNTGGTGYTGWSYIAMLFASVDGISKVGSYTGSNGSASPGGDIAQTITTGFSPRFVIIKRIDSNNNWLVLDTTRGWGAGGDANLFLDETWAQSSFNFGAPTSTGFGLTYDELGYYNSNGGKYIYYAHA